MKKYGLIGYPLTHSFSKKYFENKFSELNLQEYAYENYELRDLDQFTGLIQNNGELLGLNVTIPYKEKIISFLDEVDPEAKSIGAVNTIKIERNKSAIHLKGYNTDIYGFAMSIKPFLKNTHQRALVLGSGGASKAVIQVLKNIGIDYIIISRNPTEGQLNYESLNKYILKSHLLIINTTPLGMFPNNNSCPSIPYEYITNEHLLYDLIYNPVETLFLRLGKEKGAITLNGMNMLKLQAEKSWEIWNH